MRLNLFAAATLVFAVGVASAVPAAAQAPAPRIIKPGQTREEAAPKPPPPMVAGPIPRAADGKPDMAGVFSSAGQVPGTPRDNISFQPEAKKKHDLLVSRQLADNPTARCLSPGIISLTTVPFFPVQFVYTPGQLVGLYEWDHFFRVIPTDGRKQVEDPDTLQSLGHSVGKWEGDTLVVDVVGLSDYTWISSNAGIHSDALHIVERYTMTDSNTIEYRATLEDPKMWTKPWTTSALLKRRPAGDALMEYNCAEDNKELDHPPAHEVVR